MGTRGIWSIFFRGRYYVYYNHFDSYPEGLGQTLIDQVPVEPEELRRWLAALRARFAAHERRLEDELLIYDDAIHVNYDDDAARSAAFRYDAHHHWPPHSWRLLGLNDAVFSAAPELCVPGSMRGITMDGHVMRLPSPLVSSMWECDAEWMYVVDLDRETFTCCRTWPERWLWRLDAIPRGEAYDAALKRDENVARLLTRDLSEHTSTVSPGGSLHPDDAALFEGYVATAEYKRYRIAVVDESLLLRRPICGDGELPNGWCDYYPKDEFDEDSPYAASHLLRLFLFQQLVSRFRRELGENVIPGASKSLATYAGADAGGSEPAGNMSATDFMYREFAFALVSIACGEYALVDKNSTRVYEPQDLSFSVMRVPEQGKDGGQIVTWLPAFGSGVHQRGVTPGCAPTTMTYWFEDVLISVVPANQGSDDSGDADIIATIDAARAYAARTCLRLPPSEEFHGVVVSLAGIVLYRARISSDAANDDDGSPTDVKDTAEHAADAAPRGTTSPIVSVSEYMPLLPEEFLVSHAATRLPWGSGAFGALMHHFDAALPPVGQRNCGALPDELLECVLDAVGAAGHWRAYSGLARATPALRRYARRRVVLHNVVLRHVDAWVHSRRSKQPMCDGLSYTVFGGRGSDANGGDEQEAKQAGGKAVKYLVPLTRQNMDRLSDSHGERALHLVLGNDPQQLCLMEETGVIVSSLWSDWSI